MGRWFSSAAQRTAVRSMDRRVGRSCTPRARAPGSGVGPGGISDGYSCCQSQPTSWCRPPRIRTAGSRISHTGHSPELPSDTGFGHPKKERKLEVIQRKGHVIQHRQVQASHFCINEYFIVCTCHDGGHTRHLNVPHQIQFQFFVGGHFILVIC